LALAFGCTKAELKRRMSSAEFAEWVAWNRIEPLGERRADLRMAVLSSVIANAHRDPDKPPVKAIDFWFDFDQTVEAKQSPEQQLAQIELWNAALGGRDLRKQRPTSQSKKRGTVVLKEKTNA